MALGEVTGATFQEVKSREGEYYNTPRWLEHDIPFDTAFCLIPIGKQPDDYDGPQRYCLNRVAKRDDYRGAETDKESYGDACRFHGGAIRDKNRPKINIKHGLKATNYNLMMDFTEAEQKLYDSIMEGWPEIYDWPDQSEDPARYRLLRRVAVNEVRSVRAEDYLDEEGEVHVKEIPTENGVQKEEVENPLSREYRLLMSEITDQMKELGLTPKERQKMDTLEAQEDKENSFSEVARDALNSDAEYNPEDFEDD